jgi:hypothetical protein
VLDAVFDHLGAESAAVLAVFCAGPPALCFAAARPRRVSRLALYGSYAVGSDNTVVTRAAAPMIDRSR